MLCCKSPHQAAVYKLPILVLPFWCAVLEPCLWLSARASKVSYAEEFDSELDSDPEDAKKKSKANMAVALMDSTAELDDEVERVLGHRYAA